MIMEEKNQHIIEYINNVAKSVNESIPDFIDDDKIKRAIEMFSNRDEDIPTIEKEIHDLVEKMLQEKLERDAMYEKMIVENIQQINEEDLRQFTLDLGNDKNGLYLSQQQIDLLMITELSSKEELNNYISNITCQFTKEDIERMNLEYQSLDLETAKKKLYDEYLKTLDSYLDDAIMSKDEKALSKLSKLGFNEQEQQNILNYMNQNGIDKTLTALRQSKGDQFIIKFNRLMRDDFENVKSVGYDEMSELSRLIDRDKSIDSLIIATGKYGNTIYSNGTGKYFDPYLTDKALKYCEKHNLHMRYHTLFDYSHIESLIAQGKTSNDKEQILADMKIYIQKSFEYINSHNKTLPDGTKLINVVEVFNELVEKNKSDSEKTQPYQMKWEKEFGITINDLMSCFDGIEKPAGVEFMYNETTLTESAEKRKKVESVLDNIEKANPGFIDIFGDQSHLSDEDLKNDGKEVKETASMLKRIQDKGKKIEITEHDFHFSKQFINYFNDAVKSGKYKIEEIKTIKKNMQDKVSKYYKDAGLRIEKSTYWNTFNKNDHNIVRTNRKIAKKNKEQNKNIPLVKDMYAGTLDDGKNIDKISSLNSKKENTTKLQAGRGPEIKSFGWKSQNEKQKYELKMQKNQIMAMNNPRYQQLYQNQQSLQNKPKVKTLTQNASNKGFTNVITLSLITSFVAGALFMLMYFILK